METLPAAASRRSIQVLRNAVARRIAAGEVIDRPNAVVRELLDNSLDAGAGEIELRISGGGNERIQVTDNGLGMDPDDLSRCHLSHATSKISTDRDLEEVRTLGFRGEALSAVAHVSKLEIRSRTPESDGHRLVVHGGRQIYLEPCATQKGTTVTVDELFYELPARKRFLKRAQSESAAIRSVLLDKALPFPDTTFRFFTGEDLKLRLPAGDQLERIALAYPAYAQPGRMQELTGERDQYGLTLFAGDPADARNDRRALQEFVNKRRVWEYALVQAVEYAYEDFLRGGLHPVAYLFLEIDPHQVDFNIHPAKREVKIRNLSEIHSTVVQLLREYLRGFNVQSSYQAVGVETPQFRFPSPAPPPRARYDLARTFDPWSGRPTTVAEDAGTVPTGEWHGIRYLGQLFGLFLVVELENSLYLIDQHAAHERLIYDALRAQPKSQALLVPIAVELEPAESDLAGASLDAFQRAGFELAHVGSHTWEVRSVPSYPSLTEEQVHGIVHEFLSQPANVERQLFSTVACRAAIMDGDRIDPQTALRIASGALELENARCPHGRPLWVRLERGQLMELVGRQSDDSMD